MLHKVESNLAMLLLIFMVAGAFFLKDLLLFVHSHLAGGEIKVIEPLFCTAAAVLSLSWTH